MSGFMHLHQSRHFSVSLKYSVHFQLYLYHRDAEVEGYGKYISVTGIMIDSRFSYCRHMDKVYKAEVSENVETVIQEIHCVISLGDWTNHRKRLRNLYGYIFC